MIDRRQFKEDLEAERVLAQLEGRSFNTRDFWQQYRPAIEQELVREGTQLTVRLAVKSVRQSRQSTFKRDTQYKLRNLLQQLVNAGLGTSAIAADLSVRGIPKTNGLFGVWTRGGVQDLLKRFNIKPHGNKQVSKAHLRKLATKPHTAKPRNSYNFVWCGKCTNTAKAARCKRHR